MLRTVGSMPSFQAQMVIDDDSMMGSAAAPKKGDGNLGRISLRKSWGSIATATSATTTDEGGQQQQPAKVRKSLHKSISGFGDAVLSAITQKRIEMAEKRKTEINILCSDLVVSTEFTLGRFKFVEETPNVVTVELEDLIERHDQTLFLHTKDLITCDKRPWKSVTLIDHIYSEERLERYLNLRWDLWRLIGLDVIKRKIPIRFRAIVDINRGTTINIVIATLQQLLDAQHLYAIEFDGALFGLVQWDIPKELLRLCRDGYLRETISLKVTFHHRSEEGDDNKNKIATGAGRRSIRVLGACIVRLQGLLDHNSKVGGTSNNTANSARGTESKGPEAIKRENSVSSLPNNSSPKEEPSGGKSDETLPALEKPPRRCASTGNLDKRLQPRDAKAQANQRWNAAMPVINRNSSRKKLMAMRKSLQRTIDIKCEEAMLGIQALDIDEVDHDASDDDDDDNNNNNFNRMKSGQIAHASSLESGQRQHHRRPSRRRSKISAMSGSRPSTTGRSSIRRSKSMDDSFSSRLHSNLGLSSSRWKSDDIDNSDLSPPVRGRRKEKTGFKRSSTGDHSPSGVTKQILRRPSTVKNNSFSGGSRRKSDDMDNSNRRAFTQSPVRGRRKEKKRLRRSSTLDHSPSGVTERILRRPSTTKNESFSGGGRTRLRRSSTMDESLSDASYNDLRKSSTMDDSFSSRSSTGRRHTKSVKDDFISRASRNRTRLRRSMTMEDGRAARLRRQSTTDFEPFSRMGNTRRKSGVRDAHGNLFAAFLDNSFSTGGRRRQRPSLMIENSPLSSYQNELNNILPSIRPIPAPKEDEEEDTKSIGSNKQVADTQAPLINEQSQDDSSSLSSVLTSSDSSFSSKDDEPLVDSFGPPSDWVSATNLHNSKESLTLTDLALHVTDLSGPERVAPEELRQKGEEGLDSPGECGETGSSISTKEVTSDATKSSRDEDSVIESPMLRFPSNWSPASASELAFLAFKELMPLCDGRPERIQEVIDDLNRRRKQYLEEDSLKACKTRSGRRDAAAAAAANGQSPGIIAPTTSNLHNEFLPLTDLNSPEETSQEDEEEMSSSGARFVEEEGSMCSEGAANESSMSSKDDEFVHKSTVLPYDAASASARNLHNASLNLTVLALAEEATQEDEEGTVSGGRNCGEENSLSSRADASESSMSSNDDESVNESPELPYEEATEEEEGIVSGGRCCESLSSRADASESSLSSNDDESANQTPELRHEEATEEEEEGVVSGGKFCEEEGSLSSQGDGSESSMSGKDDESAHELPELPCDWAPASASNLLDSSLNLTDLLAEEATQEEKEGVDSGGSEWSLEGAGTNRKKLSKMKGKTRKASQGVEWVNSCPDLHGLRNRMRKSSSNDLKGMSQGTHSRNAYQKGKVTRSKSVHSLIKGRSRAPHEKKSHQKGKLTRSKSAHSLIKDDESVNEPSELPCYDWASASARNLNNASLHLTDPLAEEAPEEEEEGVVSGGKFCDDSSLSSGGDGSESSMSSNDESVNESPELPYDWASASAGNLLDSSLNLKDLVAEEATQEEEEGVDSGSSEGSLEGTGTNRKKWSKMKGKTRKASQGVEWVNSCPDLHGLRNRMRKSSSNDLKGMPQGTHSRNSHQKKNVTRSKSVHSLSSSSDLKGLTPNTQLKDSRQKKNTKRSKSAISAIMNGPLAPIQFNSKSKSALDARESASNLADGESRKLRTSSSIRGAQLRSSRQRRKVTRSNSAHSIMMTGPLAPHQFSSNSMSASNLADLSRKKPPNVPPKDFKAPSTGTHLKTSRQRRKISRSKSAHSTVMGGSLAPHQFFSSSMSDLEMKEFYSNLADDESDSTETDEEEDDDEEERPSPNGEISQHGNGSFESSMVEMWLGESS